MSVPSRLLFEVEESGPQRAELAAGRVVFYCARGPGKRDNEDALALIPFDERSGVIAVADGLGGQPAGAHAARLAIESLARSLERARGGGGSLRDGILDGFEQANRRVQALRQGAGTTLAALELRDRTVRTYHVGDTEILVVGQRGKVRQRTIAHSPVGYAVEAGLLDARSAMHHEHRHLVFNVVGSPEMRIEVGPVLRLQVRDTALVASDGLFDNLHLEEIVELARRGPLERQAQRLIELCRLRMSAAEPGHPSKPDDLSFVLYRP